MKDIIECIQGFTSPMNTLGMGDVNPSTDFIGISIKRNKHRKKKMKNLKDVLKSKLFESLNSDNLPSKKQKSEDLNEFLSNILTDSNDIKLFIGNYHDTIDERGFNDIKDAIVYWYNTGNGLRTIIFDLWLGNKSTLIIFGKDDMYRVIDDLNSFNSKEGKQYLYI